MTRSEHNPKAPGHHVAGHAPLAVHHHPDDRHQPHHRHHPQHPHDADYASGRRRWGDIRRAIVRFFRKKTVRRIFWSGTLIFAIGIVGIVALWWRLSSGPIELDMATPWLKAAIEQNFGSKHTVAVGGTQIELDENQRASLRLRDIVVRDADGTVVASAPKAEVGLSGMSLLHGNLRAVSLNLVGAEMAVRIEKDGSVTVFAGADKRPIATALPAPAPTQRGNAASIVPKGPLRSGVNDVAGVLAWIDGLGATGLDGHDLRELGLKSGNLTVDDQRNGKHWSFTSINASLTRPSKGGVIFRLASENPERPWVMSAAMQPLGDGVRAVGIEARHVFSRDILLAMRLNGGDFEPDLPLSASVRAEIASDGTLQQLQGQVVSDSGVIIDNENERGNIKIEHADVRFSWDPQHHALIVPFQVHAAGNQFTMRAILEQPAANSGVWRLTVARSDAVIDPVILAAPGTTTDPEGFAFNHAMVRARIDTVHKRIDLDQGDFSRADTRPDYNVGFAVTGSLDYSGAVPHLAFGVACTRMPVTVVKRIWPIFAATDVRDWAEKNISGGTVERIVIAGNAPLPTFKANGPPLPDDGLTIDLVTSGTSLRPAENLPEIHDADLTVRVVGRNANVSLGRGTVEMAPGRKLSVTSGIFVVPDTHPKPAPARVSLRIDGSVAAAAVLLSSDAFRGDTAISLDPNASRGNVAAQVAVNMLVGRNVPKDSADYSITADLTNFAADKLLLGRKVEAPSLRVTASKEGYQLKGEVKINSTPAMITLVKTKDNPSAELQLRAMIDEGARRRLGIDFGDTVAGAIPVKVTAQVGNDSSDVRMNVDADLTAVKIDNLLPGWVKLPGKPAHATGTLIRGVKTVRFDDLTITAPGATVKGSVEIDDASEIVSANFPVFSLQDGDKVSLKADRGGDGVLRVAMHGDVYDGRNFVKASLAGHAPEKSKQKQEDLDLDIKIGTVAGHNGEALRGLDLKLQRRNGHIRHFTLDAKIGRDTPLKGDLRLRASDKHQVVYFETDDAGALFRFTDMYPRMFGGQMWVAMDPPTEDQAPQVGTVNIHNFVVRGEPALERVVSGAPGSNHDSVQFTEMHADFTRFPGKMAVREGIVRGPLIGVTVEGQVDYVKNAVHLRGTFVPFYGLNNMFGQIPIVGFFLGGGSKEGLLGITYEATGPPGSPRITVNPVTAIAPGLLRKFIPSPGTFDSNFVPPKQ